MPRKFVSYVLCYRCEYRKPERKSYIVGRRRYCKECLDSMLDRVWREAGLVRPIR